MKFWFGIFDLNLVIKVNLSCKIRLKSLSVRPKNYLFILYLFTDFHRENGFKASKSASLKLSDQAEAYRVKKVKKIVRIPSS